MPTSMNSEDCLLKHFSSCLLLKMIAAQRRERRVSGPRLLLDEVIEVNLAVLVLILIRTPLIEYQHRYFAPTSSVFELPGLASFNNVVLCNQQCLVNHMKISIENAI